MEDNLLGDSLSGTRWIGAGSTALGLEGQLQGFVRGRSAAGGASFGAHPSASLWIVLL